MIIRMTTPRTVSILHIDIFSFFRFYCITILFASLFQYKMSLNSRIGIDSPGNTQSTTSFSLPKPIYAISAQGGRGKEKYLVAAKNPVRPSEGMAEGGFKGGIPPCPSVQFGARSAPSVLFKKGSDFVKQTHTALLFRWAVD